MLNCKVRATLSTGAQLALLELNKLIMLAGELAKLAPFLPIVQTRQDNSTKQNRTQHTNTTPQLRAQETLKNPIHQNFVPGLLDRKYRPKHDQNSTDTSCAPKYMTIQRALQKALE